MFRTNPKHTPTGKKFNSIQCKTSRVWKYLPLFRAPPLCSVGTHSGHEYPSALGVVRCIIMHQICMFHVNSLVVLCFWQAASWMKILGDFWLVYLIKPRYSAKPEVSAHLLLTSGVLFTTVCSTSTRWVSWSVACHQEKASLIKPPPARWALLWCCGKANTSKNCTA